MPARETHTVLVESPIDVLARQFLLRTRDDLDRLNELVNHAVNGDWTMLEESSRLCHSIHGAGAMFGYSQLSKAAGAMESLLLDIVRSLLVTPMTDGSATLSLIDRADALARALKAADHAEPDEHSLFHERSRDR